MYDHEIEADVVLELYSIDFVLVVRCVLYLHVCVCLSNTSESSQYIDILFVCM